MTYIGEYGIANLQGVQDTISGSGAYIMFPKSSITIPVSLGSKNRFSRTNTELSVQFPFSIISSKLLIVLESQKQTGYSNLVLSHSLKGLTLDVSLQWPRGLSQETTTTTTLAYLSSSPLIPSSISFRHSLSTCFSSFHLLVY